MNTFILSGRFLIPFFVAWLGHAGWLAWDIWQMYKADFTGKGLPSSLKYEWLWLQVSGEMLLASFLLALLLGVIFYSHHRMKKDENGYLFFSAPNIFAILVISLAGFLYTSFYEPKNVEKSLKLITSIVYSRSNADFELDRNRPDEGYKNERMLTLPELYNAKRSLSSGNSPVPGDSKFLDTPQRMLKKIDFQIARKIRFPFLIILFYAVGILLGISLYRTHVILPVLIGYFIIFVAFYYGQAIFERWYKKEIVGVFLGASGMTLTLTITILIWFLLLKMKGLLKPVQESPKLEFDQENR